ncbi:hypothetical protein GGX14DRAFT_401842 [Mycena pura]|uniref:Uncharacterized protein n=1 Tax=Mycena pura TaxID=153505 RepID=A0AAD6UZF9_9AGAR|nr:hypothetical protein GGX14DRAFT_401842 [Mycena pura]
MEGSRRKDFVFLAHWMFSVALINDNKSHKSQRRLKPFADVASAALAGPERSGISQQPCLSRVNSVGKFRKPPDTLVTFPDHKVEPLPPAVQPHSHRALQVARGADATTCKIPVTLHGTTRSCVAQNLKELAPDRKFLVKA